MMQPERVVVIASSDYSKLYDRLLTQEGYTVVWFSSGLETLNYLTDHEPTLVILYEFALSDMANYDLARKIKKQFLKRKTRILFFYPGDSLDVSAIKEGKEELGVDVMVAAYIAPVRANFVQILRMIEAMDAPSCA